MKANQPCKSFLITCLDLFCLTVFRERDGHRVLQWNTGRIGERLRNAVKQGWHLGFTAFGRPPVHFTIVRRCRSGDDLQGVGLRANIQNSTIDMSTSWDGSMSRLSRRIPRSAPERCRCDVQLVSGALRRQSGILGLRDYEDVLLLESDSYRVPISNCCSARMEVTTLYPCID